MNALAEPPTLTLAEPTAAPTTTHEPITQPRLEVSTENKPRRAEQLAQTLTLAILLAVPALFCLHAACVYDPDIWWHLRTGQWILAHHTVPFTDPFSTTTAGQPWQAYSWAFELLVTQLFTRFGLFGIVAYSTGMVLAITAALYRLIQRRQRDFSVALLLTLAASLCLTHLHTPRPWHFTILFSILELDILFETRRTGKWRPLLWLPLIFAAWANTHIQFIDGLVLLAIAFAESLAARLIPALRDRTETLLSPAALAAISAASLLATLANPYTWHLYPAAYQLATQSAVLNGINELKAIPFRSLPDWTLLALTLASAAALGRARKLPLFETALFTLATYLAFKSQRDIWLLTTIAIAILAAAIPGRASARTVMPRFAPWLAIAGAALACIVAVPLIPVTEASMRAPLVANLPVLAAEFINDHHYPGPVYNNFTWGGYLLYALRQPVSIDGRAALHGDDQIDRSERTFNGKPDWATDPTLLAANLIVAPTDSPLTQLLRTTPHYQLVYTDKLATVFIPNK